jgi:hypothetical protein
MASIELKMASYVIVLRRRFAICTSPRNRESSLNDTSQLEEKNGTSFFRVKRFPII